MLRAAIVGCGAVADAHASQIQRIGDCQIVGVCDREGLMAKQLAERFHIKSHFSDVMELMESTRPDVVHIATPPPSHSNVVRRCLKEGCHVYVETPFTLNQKEAAELIGLAEGNRLKLTVGYHNQFGHAARRLRQMVHDGVLGGQPLHLECHHGHELGEAETLLRDRNHWRRQLPGQLLHSIVSHGIARIVEFLSTDAPRVFAYGFVSPMLKSMGEAEIMDELRVIISDEKGATASFTVSSHICPSLHQFRIYGPTNGLLLDQDNETLIRLSGKRFKSYAEHFLSPLLLAKQYVGNAARNARTFLANDFHVQSGMKSLIGSFYQSIREDTPPPIPYRKILLTARIMETIFAQIDAQPAQAVESSFVHAAEQMNAVGRVVVRQ